MQRVVQFKSCQHITSSRFKFIQPFLLSLESLEYPISRGCLDTDPIENSHSITIIKSSLECSDKIGSYSGIEVIIQRIPTLFFITQIFMAQKAIIESEKGSFFHVVHLWAVKHNRQKWALLSGIKALHRAYSREAKLLATLKNRAFLNQILTELPVSIHND